MSNLIWRKISRVIKEAVILIASALLTAVFMAYILVPITINDNSLKRLSINDDVIGTMAIRIWYVTGKIVGFDLLEVEDDTRRLYRNADSVSQLVSTDINCSKHLNSKSNYVANSSGIVVNEYGMFTPVRQINTKQKEYSLDDINCSTYKNKSYKQIPIYQYHFPKNLSMEDVREYKKWMERKKKEISQIMINNATVTYCWQSEYFNSAMKLGRFLKEQNLSYDEIPSAKTNAMPLLKNH